MKEEEVRRDRNMVMFGKDRVRAAPAIVRVAIQAIMKKIGLPDT